MGLWNTHAERTGVALAGGAVLLVGGSVAASSLLAGYPVLGGQAIRYAAAGLLLAGFARLRHQQLPRPAGREWCWLAVLAAVGLAGCSVLLIMATRAASPAGVGVVIGAAPLIITVAGPIAAGRRPPGRVLAAAGIVTAGAAVSQLGSTTGAGWSLPGLLLSAGALAGVAGTSLLAAPLLPRLGALAVTIYACGLAAAQLLAAAVLVRLAGGPPVLRPLTGTELAALLYLAVAVTAVVFVAWFSAVKRLGAERTGLFNGLVPIASLIAVAVIGTGTVTGMQLAGALSVLAGVTLGLTQRAGPPAVTRRPGRYPPPQQTRPDEPARQLTALLARADEERGILASAWATAEPIEAQCLPDSSSSSTARTPSCLPASGRLPWDTCLNRPPKGSLPGTTGGATSGFPTVSWESARIASSLPAVTAPASGST
jgi:drug/metabolite transporter (DMT)-like permease